MRGTERPLYDQRILARQQSEHRMNLGRFKRFFKTEGRQNGGNAACQHGFATSRRTNEKCIVRSGGGDLQGAFDVLLAADFRKIGRKCGAGIKQGCGVDLARSQWLLTGQESDRLSQIMHSIDRQRFHHGAFAGIFSRQDQPVDIPVPGRYCHRQAAAHRLDSTIEREFAKHGVALLGFGGDNSGGGEEADRHGEVKGGPLFFDVSRGQVDGDPAGREFVAGILDGGFNAVLAFLDGSFGEPNRRELRQALGNIDFHLDRISVDAEQGTGKYFSQHVPSVK